MQELRDAIRAEKDRDGDGGDDSGSGHGDEAHLEVEDDEHGACQVYEVRLDVETGEETRVHMSPLCTQSARRRAGGGR